MLPQWPNGIWVVMQVVVAIALCGCGDRGDQEMLNSAARNVQTALDTWKRGESAATLKNSSAPIEFFDDDWERSARLIEFEVTKTYLEGDGAPRCAVGLVVQYNDKSPQRVQVTYQVVTKENKTVIARDPFS